MKAHSHTRVVRLVLRSDDPQASWEARRILAACPQCLTKLISMAKALDKAWEQVRAASTYLRVTEVVEQLTPEHSDGGETTMWYRPLLTWRTRLSEPAGIVALVRVWGLPVDVNGAWKQVPRPVEVYVPQDGWVEIPLGYTQSTVVATDISVLRKNGLLSLEVVKEPTS